MVSTHNDDALARIVAAHPALFRGDNPGTYLPAGWYAIVDRLCGEIEQLLGDDIGAIQVHQVQSKFASLRFYYSLTLPEPPGEPLPATLTQHPGGFNVAAQSRHPKRQAIDGAIAMTGLASEKTCATCGMHGEQLVAGVLMYVACVRHRQRGSINAAEYIRRQRNFDGHQ